jgi:hypothetical protein
MLAVPGAALVPDTSLAATLWRQCEHQTLVQETNSVQGRRSLICHPSQKQREAKPTHKPTQFCFSLLLPQRTKTT